MSIDWLFAEYVRMPTMYGRPLYTSFFKDMLKPLICNGIITCDTKMIFPYDPLCAAWDLIDSKAYQRDLLNLIHGQQLYIHRQGIQGYDYPLYRATDLPSVRNRIGVYTNESEVIHSHSHSFTFHLYESCKMRNMDTYVCVV
jgi:hypothetical protein